MPAEPAEPAGPAGTGKTMLKVMLLGAASAAILAVNAAPALAHCPLCTAAVGAAAVSAKYYGLDLTVIGLLVGAFAVSTGLWVGLKIKKQHVKFQLPLIVLASFLLTVIPLLSVLSVSREDVFFSLLLFGEPGSLFNKVYFVDKLLFGSVLGGLASLAAFMAHVRIKRLNKGRVLFPFQGIAFTLAALGATAGILFLAFR